MKKFNLLSIFVLLFVLLFVQKVEAQTQQNGTWYVIYDTEEHSKDGMSKGEIKTYSNLQYPNTGTLSVQSYINYTLGNGELTLYQNASEFVNSVTIEKGKIWNDESFSVNTNATSFKFETPYHTYKRKIRNIFLQMATHTKLLNTSLSFNTSLTDTDGETRTVDFDSFLTGSNGMTISIVDANGNATTIDGLSLNRESVDKNTLEKVGENKYSINLTFKPTKIITNATCSIKIYNQGAAINETLYIPVTLNSSLPAPTLKCDAFGYKFAKLSWNAVSGADSYNLYDGNEKIDNYKTTNAIILGLDYGSSHSYTVTSVVGSAESNKSIALTVNCPAYPSVTGINFSNVQQNQVTVNWNSANITPANHTFVRYHVHLYKIAAGASDGEFIKAITTTETSYTFDGLIDATQYTAYVDVEYNDGENNVIESRWSSAAVSTASFIPANEFDGVKMYKGEWYRIMVNSAKDITDKTHTFSLNYPCDNLSYEAWLSGSANISHKISVDATGESINLADEDWQSNNRYKSTKPINTNIEQVNFTGNQGATGNKTIYIDNIWTKIAPHILFENANYSIGDVKIGATKPITVKFKSFLTKGNLTVTSSNGAFLIDGDKTSKTIECGVNAFCSTSDDTWDFSVTFNPSVVANNQSTTIKVTDGTSTATCTITANCIKKTPTISWIDNKQIAVGESLILSNVASSDCGTGITFESSNTDIFVIENGKLVAKQPGTATITATTTGSKDEWESVSSFVDFEATLKTIQNIVWNQDFYLLKVGGESVVLNASATDKETGNPNSNPVKYEVAAGGEGVVTIIDGVLTIVGKGQTSITATQEGNEEYAATSVTKMVYVREVSDDCSVEYALIDTKKYEEGNWLDGFNYSTMTVEKELTTVGDKLSFVTDCNGITGKVDVTGDDVKVKDQNGNVIFHETQFGTVKDVQLSRNVTKLIFEVYSNYQHSISNIFVTPAIYLETATKAINFVGAEVGKTTSIDVELDYANQPDAVRAYIQDASAEGVFSVADGVLACACGDYGTHTLKVQFTPAIQGDYSANLVIVMGEGEKAKTMMTIPITAKAIKTPQYITWNQDIQPIQGGSYELDAVASSGLPIVWESSNENVAVVENGKLVVKGAGSVTITAIQGGNQNYEAASSITKTFNIAKLDQTITWDQDFETNVPAQGESHELTASAALPVVYSTSNEAVAVIENGKLVIKGAGEVTITVSQEGNTNYNAATPISQTFTVAQLTQTISWEQEFAANLTIGNTVTMTATASSKEPVVYTSSNEAVATISDNVLTIVGVGTTQITASQSGTTNYAAAESVVKEITIAKLNQTITWTQNIDLRVGESIELSATATSGESVVYTSANEDIAIVEGTTLKVVGAGTVTIIATQAGNNTYNPIETAREFTFGLQSQTITWNDDLSALKVTDVFEFTATSSADKEVVYSIDNADVAIIEGNVLTIVGAGVANITATAAGDATYNSASAVKQISIEYLTQSITWNQDFAGLTIESESISLEATIDSELEIVYESSNPNVAIIFDGKLVILGVGEATITAKQEGNKAYSAAVSVSKNIVVNKADQAIVWEQDLSSLTLESEVVELNANSTKSLEVVYESTNTAVATIKGNQLTIVGAGTTTIVARQSGNENYNAAADVEKTITINKLTQTITWEQDLTSVSLADDYVTLTATASSGLPVVYSSSNPAVASISGNVLSIQGEGEATITASVAETERYLAAESVVKVISLAKRQQTITWEQEFDLMAGDIVALSAQASSALDVEYILDENPYAYIYNNTLYTTAPGEVEITVRQAGDKFNEAVEEVRNITIAEIPAPIFVERNETIYIELPVELNNLEILYTLYGEAEHSMLSESVANIDLISYEGEFDLKGKMENQYVYAAVRNGNCYSQIVSKTYLFKNGQVAVGVADAETSFEVYMSNDIVYVETEAGAMIEVYTLQGHCLYADTAIDAVTAIHNVPGVAIVCVNGVAVKIMNR